MSTALQSTEEAIIEPPKQTFVPSDFEFKKKLGQGGFGTVFLCREKKTDYIVAIKKIPKAKLAHDKTLVQMKREIDIQYHLQHNNILMLFAFFADINHVFIILEACQFGTLFKVLRGYKCLSVHRASYVVDCMADALNYCHDRHVIHRDIKPENILVTEQFEPKLADFGLAVQTVDTSRTVCGTPDYVSPEMLNFRKNHGHTYKTDNWAIGVLYYECLSGQTPFYNKDQAKAFENIQRGIIQKHAKITEAPMKVIKGLLTVDAKNRSELSDVRKDEFVRAEVEVFHSRRARRGAK